MRRRTTIIAVLLMALASSGCNEEPGGPAGRETAAAPPANEPDGRAIFAANCASCHNPVKESTGPALAGALKRWDNDTARIKAFIRNPSKMIADGDPYAVALYNKYNKTPMMAFPLTDAELDSLLEMMQ